MTVDETLEYGKNLDKLDSLAHELFGNKAQIQVSSEVITFDDNSCAVVTKHAVVIRQAKYFPEG